MVASGPRQCTHIDVPGESPKSTWISSLASTSARATWAVAPRPTVASMSAAPMITLKRRAARLGAYMHPPAEYCEVEDSRPRYPRGQLVSASQVTPYPRRNDGHTTVDVFPPSSPRRPRRCRGAEPSPADAGRLHPPGRARDLH